MHFDVLFISLAKKVSNEWCVWHNVSCIVTLSRNNKKIYKTNPNTRIIVDYTNNGA